MPFGFDVCSIKNGNQKRNERDPCKQGPPPGNGARDRKRQQQQKGRQNGQQPRYKCVFPHRPKVYHSRRPHYSVPAVSFAVQFSIMGDLLLRFAMHVMTYLFFVGMAGSFLVSFLVVISFSEELKDFFGDD